jgi:hypothetical protein
MAGRLPRAPLQARWCALTLGCACILSDPRGSATIEPETSSPSVPPRLQLLSAALVARVPAAEGASASGTIMAVFDGELDPTTVVPQGLAIALRDGRRVTPREVVFAPADESDENRSLFLEGAFGDVANPPVAVHVIGQLYGEEGAPARGAGTNVRDLEVPDVAVWAERLAVAEGRCPGAGTLVRTYWSDRLHGVEDDDLTKIAIVLRSADPGTTRAHPVAFDDHDGLDTDDNVLDLCLDVTADVARVEVAAGAFVDGGGRPTASVGLDVVSSVDSVGGVGEAES